MSRNRVIVDLGVVTNTCFVVMPFHALFEAEYTRVIRPAIEEAGLTCVRGDEIYAHQAIVQDIWRSVREARLIVAELSGRNPNVMYEIGLAHAIGKPIVLLTREEADLPFDLRALRYIYYDPSNPFWGQDLRSQLMKIVQKVLETPSLSTHLASIDVHTELPATPQHPVSPSAADAKWKDVSGVWRASWLSIRRQRIHEATLVVPAEHGRQFIATLTVSFVREEQQTVVQETLTGSVRDEEVSLTGVSYTYVRQGSSRVYGLDSFELRASDDGRTLQGQARLRHGTRSVTFERVPDPTATAAPGPAA